MSRNLRPIEWFTNLDLNVILRVVNISGINMRLYTNSYLHPGSYGIKQRVGNYVTVRITNSLPGKYCPPMIMNCSCGPDCKCKTGDKSNCKCNNCKCNENNSEACNCGADCKCKTGDSSNCNCNKKNKIIKLNRTCCGKPLPENMEPIHPPCCIPDTTMPMEGMPQPYEADPCTWRLHLHGFFGPANEDNYKINIKPGESHTFKYYFDPIDSLGMLIFHNHNFTTEESQVCFSSFPLVLHNDCNEFPMVNESLKISLFVQQLYMVPSTDPTVPQNTGADYEIFNYWYWNQKSFNEFSAAIKASKKFLLTNGDILPIVYLPTNELCLFDIGWFGINDSWRLTILDDSDRPVEYRVVSIDAMPVPNSNKLITTNFLLAHMQRIKIIFSLPKFGQYRLIKNPTENESNDTFSAGKVPIMLINSFNGQCCLPLPLKMIPVYPDEYITTINQKYRTLRNVAAYRNYLFNFPNMGGATMNMDPKQVQMVAGKSEVAIVGSADDGYHSYHIHLQSFCVLAWGKVSEPNVWHQYPRDEQVFQDTLMIEPGFQYLVWLFPFKYGGAVMEHCHKSLHSDFGMMLNLYISLNPNDKPSGVGLIEPTPEILKVVANSSYF